MGKKTFKREYALFFVVLLAYQIYKENTAILEIIIWPFISFIAASAGLHIYDKSISPPSPPDRLLRSGGDSTESPYK